MLAGFCSFLHLLIVLMIFPSEAQLEAKAIQKEKEIIEEMKKEVKELIAKEEIKV